jgi:branched-subunit amino acid aminotransferase/4-amino-4-deoxychorismate lyase
MLQAKPRLAESGALDLLYHDGERVFEAASASVYFVRGDAILAPSTDDVLWGTVGSLVLELADGSFTIEQRDVSLDEALTADEIFLTSTTRGVVPIVRLDDTAVGGGVPGPVTRALMALWAEALARG